MTDYSKEQILDYLEDFYCSRMVTLVDENRIADADSLHEEFAVADDEFSDFNWLFLSFLEDVS
jgi:hypothetical protein